MEVAPGPVAAPSASRVEVARGRSRLYLLLARAFAFPDDGLHREALDGGLRRQLEGATVALSYRLAAGAQKDWLPPKDYESFQSEYIRLFEVGPRGRAPCPLAGGHYAQDRLRTMEELVRFYNYFGLRISPGLMPDHITVEMEFMHYLSHEEAEALQSGGDANSYRRAQRDFLNRHPARWLPQALALAGRQRPHRFYRSLLALTGRFLAAERNPITSALCGQSGGGT